MQVCICLCLSFMSSSNINIQIITCNLIINTWIQVKKIDSNAHRGGGGGGGGSPSFL